MLLALPPRVGDSGSPSWMHPREPPLLLEAMADDVEEEVVMVGSAVGDAVVVFVPSLGSSAGKL